MRDRRGPSVLDDALLVALRAHAGQRDQDGAPYVRHVLRVMESVHDEARVVAVLQDALEDAGAEHLDPVRERLEEDELEALELLTKDAAEDYRAYIARLIAGGNRLAWLVKQADLRDNLRPCASCSAELAERYRWALEVIDAALDADLIESPEMETRPESAEEPEALSLAPGMVEVTIDPAALYDSLEVAILLGYGGSDKNRQSRVSAIPEQEPVRIPTGLRGGTVQILGQDIIDYIERNEELLRLRGSGAGG